MKPFSKELLLSSAKAMNVDGSSANKIYSYTSSGTKAVYGVSIILEDAGTSGLSGFGSISGLSNGLLIECVISGEAREIAIIKDNIDLCLKFRLNHFGNSAVGALAVPIGFGDTVDVFCGHMEFRHALLLSDSDVVRITVRDNLSNIGTLSAAIWGEED